MFTAIAIGCHDSECCRGDRCGVAVVIVIIEVVVVIVVVMVHDGRHVVVQAPLLCFCYSYS